MNRSNEEEPEDPLAKLTDGQWRVSTMSALYELKYNTAKLKQYASKIKQILSCSIAENRSIKYNVTVELNSALRKNETDPCALTIIIRTVTGSEPEVTSYVAILMSWGVYENVPLATHLPYLLERGRQQIGDAVKTMLTKLFDCCIAPVQFTKEQMVLLTLNFCRIDPCNPSTDIKFIYKLQERCNGVITLTINIAGLRAICDSTRKKLEVPTREEEAEGVYVGLQRHVFLRAHMNIGIMELCKVSHPRASVVRTGVFSARTPNIITFMFQYFNEAFLTHVK